MISDGGHDGMPPVAWAEALSLLIAGIMAVIDLPAKRDVILV
jgi:hypothetical protein